MLATVKSGLYQPVFLITLKYFQQRAMLMYNTRVFPVKLFLGKLLWRGEYLSYIQISFTSFTFAYFCYLIYCKLSTCIWNFINNCSTVFFLLKNNRTLHIFKCSLRVQHIENQKLHTALSSHVVLNHCIIKLTFF